MSSGNIFKEASSLFRRKKYSQVITLLEPKITLYRSSFQYFRFLGLSCLYRRDWGSAYSYLRSAFLINSDNIEIASSYGLILVRQGDRKAGLDILLHIVENPASRKKTGYRKAQKTIEMIRKYGNEKDIVAMLESKRFFKYFPHPPYNPLPIILILLLLFTAAGTYLSYRIMTRNNTSRENIQVITIDSEKTISDFSNQNYNYLLSNREIISAFSRARDYLEKYEDNMARREINRLINSNASIGIKQKALALTKVIQRPELKDIIRTFSFEEVYSDPFLYDHCYIKWKGRLSNLKIGKKQIQFDFLVGYHDRKIVEGIVPAFIDYEVLLNDDFAYELLAMIIPADANIDLDVENVDEYKGFSLKVISIRRINP